MKQLLFSRKGLILLFLLAIGFIQAQTINTTYKTSINAKLAGLDKTKVPNKLLINQAMEFAELSDYSGSFTTTNFTTKGKYTCIYNTLLMSRVQSSVTGLINPTTFKTNWDNLRQPNKIVLSGLYYKYSKFKSDAFPNFLVNNNDVVTDKYVSGVWQNPYIDQQVFAIASPILIYKSLTLQVTLPASLWYTNQSTAVQSIAIDFGNGAGYQTMTLGQVRSITYPSSGIYEWKYKLTLTNAQILYSHSKLNIDIPTLGTPPTNPYNSSQSIQLNGQMQASQAIVNPPPASCANVAIIPITGTRQYAGSANSATLQVKYLQNDCIIRNPLIIVEGFDSGLLGVENPFGEVSYIDFLKTTYPSYDLYSQVVNKDIIYINFNNGRDDLRRNAYLVEDIIKWVNTKKAQAGSTTPNIVLGQSMGGVIARYALRDMEVLGQAHQTNLFISHDAPQQGANIPLGIQYFARHLADQFISTPLGDYQIPIEGGNISIADIQSLLNAQGTKQLVSNYINGSFGLDNTAFNTFQTELHNLGYPTQTRNIALSNGNHCANPQSFNPSATLFSLYGDASTTALTTALSALLQPITNVGFGYLAYEFNEQGLLLGLIPGSSNFNMNFSANALPSSGTSNQIYSGSISYTKKIFSLFGWNPQITVYLTDRQFSNPVSLSYDYYPGGKYQLPFDFNATNIHNDWINVGINVYLAPSFDFIPVPSALDIGNGTTTLTNTDYLKKYNSATPPLAPKSSPFANFTTSFPNGANVNEPHISFNTRNGNWLATELDAIANNNQVFDCSFICSDATISGNNILCTSAVYSAPTSTANIFNWSITQGSNLVTLSTNGSSNMTITALPNVSGSVTISLIMGDNGARCGNTTITKTIWVGKPDFYLDIYSTPQQPDKTFVTMLSTSTITPIEEQGITTTTITKVSNTNTVEDIKWQGQMFVGKMNPFYTNSVTATATNSCGTTSVTVNILEGNRQANTDSNFKTDNSIYKIYPNPSSDFVNIDLRDENNLPQKNAIISGELFDMLGLLKSKVNITGNKASFSVKGLNKGIYVLKIYINDQVESHQIAVE